MARLKGSPSVLKEREMVMARLKSSPSVLRERDEYMTILCIATYFKGDPFLREAKRQGATVLLLTADTLAGADWPRDSIDEIHTIARDSDDAAIRRRVDAIARRHRI